MAEKVLLIADPGIDSAFAISMALNAPELEVVALAATAGNVSAQLATRNMHILITQLDPPRWPRIGSALPIEYEGDGTRLHGPDGLGGLDFPCAQPHHALSSDKLIGDTLRLYPEEVTVVLMGPATVLARAFDRDAELPRLMQRLIIVGGTWREPGDAGPVSEFHFWCDPPAARQVLRSGAAITLLPLDITRQLVLSPGDIQQIASIPSPTGQFLGKVLPLLLVPTAGLYGIEGAYLNDALAIAYLLRPKTFTLQPMAVDVEVTGELTRGMSVFDARWGSSSRPNVELATAVDIQAVRGCIQHLLSEQH